MGPPGRQARRRRAEERVHRRLRLRPGGDARRGFAARRREAQRRPHRGRDRQALRLRAGLEGDRRARPGPRRPRLRDRRVAEGARREADPGRAGAARHAHQPHLRGLDGDHAPADRARGRRPAPAGRGRHPRERDAAGGEGQERGRGGRLLRQVAAQAGRRRGPQAEGLRRVRRAGHAPALRRALVPPPGPLDLLRDGPLAGQARAAPVVPGPDRRHRRRAVRDLRRGRLRRHDRPRDAGARRLRPRAGRPVLRAGPAPRRRALPRALEQRRRPRLQGRR